MKIQDLENGMVSMTRVSPIDGKENTMIIVLDMISFMASHAIWVGGTDVQGAFPTLSADEREFIRIGITPDQSKEMYEDEEV